MHQPPKHPDVVGEHETLEFCHTFQRTYDHEKKKKRNEEFIMNLYKEIPSFSDEPLLKISQRLPFMACSLT